MYNLEKKQKIILAIIITIIIGCACYYLYIKDNNEMQQIENKLEIENKQQEEKEDNETLIVVHISGAVKKEGIIELKAKSRIADAIDKAGGIREDAYIEDINLAYILEDGMKIHIPTKQEKQEQEIQEKSQNEQSKNTNQNKDITNKYITTSSGIKEIEKEISTNQKEEKVKININTATQAELETLTGIGPTTAMKIINYREQNGKFKKIEDIKQVSGIGDGKFEKIKNQITV